MNELVILLVVFNVALIIFVINRMFRISELHRERKEKILSLGTDFWKITTMLTDQWVNSEKKVKNLEIALKEREDILDLQRKRISQLQSNQANDYSVHQQKINDLQKDLARIKSMRDETISKNRELSERLSKAFSRIDEHVIRNRELIEECEAQKLIIVNQSKTCEKLKVDIGNLRILKRLFGC